jgi:hypothetical protein
MPRRITYLLALLLTTVLAAEVSAQGKTPHKTDAVWFSVLRSLSGSQFSKGSETALAAEGYGLETFTRTGFGDGTATIAKLAKIAEDDEHAVLIIATHAGLGSIDLQVFDTEKKRNAALKKLKNDKDNEHFSGSLRKGVSRDDKDNQQGGLKKQPAINISAAGLAKMFGSLSNRNILIIAGCRSVNLSNNSQTFGHTEFVGMKKGCGKELAGNVKEGLERMGGSDGIDKRPAGEAFDTQEMAHVGPGDTTLAPAITGEMPVRNFELDLGTMYAGSTEYDTVSRQSPDIIMAVEDPGVCDETLDNQDWVSGTEHSFTIKATTNGRLVLKVQDPLAVSLNNERELIGNRFKHNLGEDPLVDDARVPVEICDYAQTGLDSLMNPQADDPYRWCLWCGEKPPDPTPDPRESDPAKPTSQSIPDVDVPWGETHAFIWYQNDPEPATVLTGLGLPSNFSVTQVGTWYAHVIYSPLLSQLGYADAVTLQSADGGGVRESQNVTFTVVARDDEVKLTQPSSDAGGGAIDVLAIEPGDTADYVLLLGNTGNTALDGISLNPLTLTGPGVIPDTAVTVTPTFVDLLMPGDSVEVQVSVATTGAEASGSYTGQIEIVASTTQAGFLQNVPYPLDVGWRPNINVPGIVQSFVVGDMISIPLTGSDGDGDIPDYSMLSGPDGASFEVVGGPNDLQFDWIPGPKDTGLRSVLLDADDGLFVEGFALDFQIEGPANPNVVSLTTAPYMTDDTLELSTGVLNNNDVGVDVYMTLEIFDFDFSGSPVYSTGEVYLGFFSAEEEQFFPDSIPTLGLGLTAPAVRVTLRTDLGGTMYFDTSELNISLSVPALGKGQRLGLALLLGAVAAAVAGQRARRRARPRI